MSKTWLAFSIMITLSAGGNAFGQQKFLDGAYGNKEGCIYAKTGESSGSDEFFLLTDEAITTATAYCEFSGDVTKKDTSFAAKVSCSAEGESEASEFNIDILREKDGYIIDFKDGAARWGPLPKCK